MTFASVAVGRDPSPNGITPWCARSRFARSLAGRPDGRADPNLDEMLPGEPVNTTEPSELSRETRWIEPPVSPAELTVKATRTAAEVSSSFQGWSGMAKTKELAGR